MLVVIAALSYRDVKISARILGVALILEVIMSWWRGRASLTWNSALIRPGPIAIATIRSDR